jgi:hypothetical protein
MPAPILSSQPNARLGLDGRIRPVSSADGRLRAGEIIRERPHTPLREIAREAGVSVSTAQDVRKRMERGEHPMPDGSSRRAIRRSADLGDSSSLLTTLRGDPSVRFSQTGRLLLQWLGVSVVQEGHKHVVDAIPQHCTEAVAILARDCARLWIVLADELERRSTAGM